MRWAYRLLTSLGLTTACSDPPPRAETKTDAGAPRDARPQALSERASADESAHHVVFADRVSTSYVLLLAPTTPDDFSAPSRAALQDMIRATYSGHERDEEVRLLLRLASLDPASARRDGTLELPSSPMDERDETNLDASDDENGVEQSPNAPAPPSERRSADLLGLRVELHRASSTPDHYGLIPTRFLDDPVTTRALSEGERGSLKHRPWQLVLTADYRNRRGVRGLRLLQALTLLVADETGALIYDPDTTEILDLTTFRARRLQTRLANVADQVVVVPFPDRRHPGHIRLTTRGMRRFGSVDIELDGLPRDPWLLQSATYLLHGLALQLIRLGELGELGLASELDDTVSVHYRDCAQAYAGRGERLPRCRSCPEFVLVHLVERPPEDHDPVGHGVARVVAPRATSDRPDYDATAWASAAIERVLGPPPRATTK
jgi:hypothetical protein